MKLYYSPGACSLAPHIALREAGLSFDVARVDLRAKKTEAGDDYLTLNPKGQVPLLMLDGDKLTEVPAVMQYIADQAPAAGLAPAAGTMARYHLQEWLNFITSELHKSFVALIGKTLSDEAKATYKKRIEQRFAYIDQQLGGRQYLLGDKFTIADCYLFVVLRWAHGFKLDMAPLANLTAFFERVSARPTVQEAMKAEGLSAA